MITGLVLTLAATWSDVSRSRPCCWASASQAKACTAMVSRLFAATVHNVTGLVTTMRDGVARGCAYPFHRPSRDGVAAEGGWRDGGDAMSAAAAVWRGGL